MSEIRRPRRALCLAAVVVDERIIFCIVDLAHHLILASVIECDALKNERDKLVLIRAPSAPIIEQKSVRCVFLRVSDLLEILVKIQKVVNQQIFRKDFPELLRPLSDRRIFVLHPHHLPRLDR